MHNVVIVGAKQQPAFPLGSQLIGSQFVNSWAADLFHRRMNFKTGEESISYGFKLHRKK
jgi:hypothetical protein